MVGLASNLQINLGKIAILTILNLPTQGSANMVRKPNLAYSCMPWAKNGFYIFGRVIRNKKIKEYSTEICGLKSHQYLLSGSLRKGLSTSVLTFGYGTPLHLFSSLVSFEMFCGFHSTALIHLLLNVCLSVYYCGPHLKNRCYK